MNRLPVGCSTCAHKTIPTECAPCSECALSRPGGSAQVYWEGDAGYISQVKIKRLSAYARIPFHGTPGAAGYDLYAASVWYDRSEQILKIGSGLAFEIPSGYVGLLFPRSSMKLFLRCPFFHSQIQGTTNLPTFFRCNLAGTLL